MRQRRCITTADAELLVQGTLDEASSSVIRAHVVECMKCRRRIASVRRNLLFVNRLAKHLGEGGQCLSPSTPDGLSSPEREAPDTEEEPRHRPGVTGRYEVLDELGRGGMAVVYRARQINASRLVALKVLSVAQAFDEHRTRLLEREARVLAMLRHPNLAAIHDAGRTDDHRPFLAMELVEGAPLVKEAVRRGLSLRQRLELFLKVCDAVAHAHQRGIIHRDLKPGNILVDATGEPKVLDFGLARVIETDASVLPGSVVSEYDAVCGTLPYMSPEQVQGRREAVDVRSDVYALGVILFELLTGTLPYRVDRTNLPAAARTICEVPPLRPGDLARSLRGDIETIMLKALEKEPDRRYATVPALADDIRRLLVGEPISARPMTLGYQLRKLVLRHQAPFAIAAIAFVTMAALSAVLAVQATRLERQREAAVEARQNEAAARAEAHRQAEIAIAVNSFINDMLAAASPDQGGEARDIKVISVLDTAAAALKATFPEQPEVEASIRFTLGNTYRALGQFEEAEAHLRGSLELLRARHQGDHEDVAQALNKLARVLQERGAYEDSEAAFREALAMNRRVHGESHPQVAKLLNNLGWLLYLRGEIDEAEGLCRQSLERHLAKAEGEPIQAASVMNNLALILMKQGRLEEAEPLFRRALEVDREERGDDHPNVIYTTINHAVLLARLDRFAEAEHAMRDAAERLRGLLGEAHVNVAVAMHNLGWIVRIQGRLEEAESYYQEALSIFRAGVGEDHPRVAQTFEHLAELNKLREEYEAAESFRQKAERIRSGTPK